MSKKRPPNIPFLRVLVTRPKEQAGKLCQMITKAGWLAETFPTIEIRPLNSDHLNKTLDEVNNFNYAIFISPVSVEMLFARINTLPDSLKLVAVGSSTQKKLESRLNTKVISPERFDTEGLLELPEFQAGQIEGQRVLIFKGKGGRPLLEDSLKQRGAEVQLAELYERVVPDTTRALDDILPGIDLITISSNTGLSNLISMAENTDLLRSKILVTPSVRATKLAKDSGFIHIIQADNATDAAMISAMTTYADATHKYV